MKKILYPILAVMAFFILQAGLGVIISVVAIALHPEASKTALASGDSNALMEQVGTEWLSIAVILSGVLTIAVLALLKMIDWKSVLNMKMIDWKWGFFGIVAAIAGIFVLDIAEEMMDLPNLMEDTFTNMSNSIVGALCIGVVGPIIEEFIFREGVEGYMLRNGVNKWVAIIGSALAFGIIHLNPAQVPFAAAMGIILGILYYKSGNIVLTSILHILNNSVAVWQMYSMGESAKDFSLTEALGTSTICCVIIGSWLCVFLLMEFWKFYQSKQQAIPDLKTDINN